MDILKFVLYLLLLLSSLFLILLVMIQRGKGGGLAGALGGMGGYSAFGTRAGDLFTRITIVTAAVWILLAMALAKMNLSSSQIYQNQGVTPGTGGGRPAAASGESNENEGDDAMPGTDSSPSGAESDSSSKKDSKAEPAAADKAPGAIELKPSDNPPEQ